MRLQLRHTSKPSAKSTQENLGTHKQKRGYLYWRLNAEGPNEGPTGVTRISSVQHLVKKLVLTETGIQMSKIFSPRKRTLRDDRIGGL